MGHAGFRRAALAGAAAAAVVPAAATAAISNVRVAQEGLGFRVAWDGPASYASVQVSSAPDFPAGASCIQLVASGNSALVSCLKTAFTGVVYVQVSSGLDKASAQAPASAFTFAPAAPPSTEASLVNRRTVTCGVGAAWGNTDASTTYTARLTSGATLVKEREVGNPIPGQFGPSPLDRTFSYELSGADTGGDVVCTVTAANGVNTAATTRTYHVMRVAAARVNPSRVLESLVLEKYLGKDINDVSVSLAARRRGLRAQATLAQGPGLPSPVITLMIYSTPAKARRSTTGFCRSLRRVYRTKNRALPSGLVSCGRVRGVGGARPMYSAIAYVTRRSDLGAYHVTTRILGGARGNAAFLVNGNAIGAPTVRGVRAKATADATGAARELAAALARE